MLYYGFYKNTFGRSSLPKILEKKPRNDIVGALSKFLNCDRF